MRNLLILTLCVALALVTAPAFAAGNAYGRPIVSQAARHDVSPALRDIKPIPPQAGPAREKFEPKRILHTDGLAANASDPAL
jgi:hypothetical protein